MPVSLNIIPHTYSSNNWKYASFIFGYVYKWNFILDTVVFKTASLACEVTTVVCKTAWLYTCMNILSKAASRYIIFVERVIANHTQSHVEIMGWKRGGRDRKFKKHGEKIKEENKLSWITGRILRDQIKTLWFLNVTTHRAIFLSKYWNIFKFDKVGMGLMQNFWDPTYRCRKQRWLPGTLSSAGMCC